jgi:hypothetical protein
MLGIARIEARNNKPLNWNENIRQWSVKRLINERWVVRRLHWWRVLQPAGHALLKYLSKVGALKKKVENDRRKPFSNSLDGIFREGSA